MPGTPKIENSVNGSLASFVEQTPLGDYQLVAWELDLTGRRLLDEICQISAYAPGNEFSQYVMPYRRPNPAAQHRHNIKIVSTGRYRVMKNNTTGKILRTKSEISALVDFLAWMEKIRGKDGVILVSYEARTVIPHILLESLRKYNMLDEFCAIVKGFINGFKVAEKNSTKAVNNNSLHSMSRLLLNRDDAMETSLDRARITLEVVLHLCGPQKEGTTSPELALKTEVDDKGDQLRGSGDSSLATRAELTAAVCKHAITVQAEEKELAALKALLARQSTFRPIFGPMVQKNRRERQRASVQRQLIAEAGLDYAILQTAFKEKGKEGIEKLLTEKLTSANSKVTEELSNLLAEHFDPPKEEDVTTLNGNGEITPTVKIEKTVDNKTAANGGPESPPALVVASANNSPTSSSYESSVSTPPGVDAPALAPTSSPEH